MKSYQSIHMVKTEDLNHHGTLFAARTASWFVESAFVAAACEYQVTSELVCRNMHGMSFTHPVQNGDIICFSSRIARVGKSSMTVHVSVDSMLGDFRAVDGFLTFVVLDDATGRPKPHGITLDETSDSQELAIRARAEKLFASREGNA